MAKTNKKVKRFVIDVNSFITIFINRQTDWLLRYIATNKLEIFIDDHLLKELVRVLEYPKIKMLLPLDTVLYVSFVRIIGTHIVAKPFQFTSPDPDDNYLFDLSLTANARLLVTGDKALLNWSASPVETMTLTEFKRLF